VADEERGWTLGGDENGSAVTGVELVVEFPNRFTAFLVLKITLRLLFSLSVDQSQKVLLDILLKAPDISCPRLCYCSVPFPRWPNALIPHYDVYVYTRTELSASPCVVV
jgi:hypothetical protein